jgi:hypothetical protein
MSEPNWRTSSYTNTETCVEVADDEPGWVLIRDTKDRNRGSLGVAPDSWIRFIESVKRG